MELKYIKLIAPYTVEGIQNSSIKELKEWLKSTKVITIDTEASGNFNHGVFGMNMIMLQIGNEHTQFVIDTRYYDISFINKVLESNAYLKIGHNIKFDTNLLRNSIGAVMNNVFDTMVSERVLTLGSSESYSLSAVVMKRLGINIDSNQLNLFLPYVSKKIRNTFSSTEDFTAAQIIYGALDVEMTHRLYKEQIMQLKLQGLSKFAKVQNDFVLVVAEMEYNGIPINTTKWMNLYNKNKEALSVIEAKLAEYESINWNSSKQVIKVFKKHNIPTNIIDKKKSKDTTIYKDSVQALHIKKYSDEYPLVKLYLEYKELIKSTTSYGVKFLDNINPFTNRIHTNIIQLLNTSRTASTSPNMQQIPRSEDFRSCIESKDGVFIIADYSSQEIHITADKTKDPLMLDILRNGGDMHKAAGAALYNISESEVTKAQRQNGKTTNFLIIYGGGASKLAESFGVQLKKAKEMLASYHERFCKIEPFQNAVFNHAIKHGYIPIDRFGAKYYIQEYPKLLSLKSKVNRLGDNCPLKIVNAYNTLISEIKRKCGNYPIQGEAATMAKLAGIYLLQYLRKNPNKFKILLLIHDEWLIETTKENSEEVKRIVEQSMILASKQLCKLLEIKAEAVIAKSWIK